VQVAPVRAGERCLASYARAYAGGKWPYADHLFHLVINSPA
jgi:hypothetical protein